MCLEIIVSIEISQAIYIVKLAQLINQMETVIQYNCEVMLFMNSLNDYKVMTYHSIYMKRSQLLRYSINLMKLIYCKGQCVNHYLRTILEACSRRNFFSRNERYNEKQQSF